MNRLPAIVLLVASSMAFGMDYTKGFALQASDGEHVGFALAAPSFSEESGDCVFVLLPVKPERVNSALGLFISESKFAGEHHWTKKGGRIVVSLAGNVVMEFTEKAEILDASGRVLGRVVPIPENAK